MLKVNKLPDDLCCMSRIQQFNELEPLAGERISDHELQEPLVGLNY